MSACKTCGGYGFTCGRGLLEPERSQFRCPDCDGSVATEPGVSPTAIEIAAKALYPNGPGDGSDALWFDVVEDVTLVIRALVDSGELVSALDFDYMAQDRDAAYAEADRLAAEVTHWKAKRNEAVSLYAARGEYLAEARAEVTRLKMVAGATPLEAFEVEHLLAEVERLSQALTAATAHAAEEADELDRLHAKNERLSQALREQIAWHDDRANWHGLGSMNQWREGAIRTHEDSAVRLRAVLGEFIQEGEPVPPNMVSVEVPRTGRPNDRYWVRREPPAREGERP